MTRPVPGPTSPEPSRGSARSESSQPDSDKFSQAMKKVEAVEKVSETEFEKPEKRPFTQPVEEDDEVTSTPSAGFEDLDPLPSPGNSFSEDRNVPTDDLPRSKNFWKKEPLPDEPPGPKKFIEGKPEPEKDQIHLPVSGKKQQPHFKGMIAPSESTQKEEKKEPSSVPWQPTPPLHAPKSAPQTKKELEAPPSPISARTPWIDSERKSSEQKKAPSSFPSSRHKEKEKKPEKKDLSFQEEELPSFTPSIEKLEEREEKSAKSHVEKIGSHAIPDPLPPGIQSTTAAAQISAAPYLSPQTAALYSKLIGSLLFMVSTTPGITRTEVVLNSDSFRNSVFYNTTVVLEKYATAPDSFNIRLQGTPEAVKLFQENSSLLMGAFTAAYDERRIHFRIGRLDTAIERPPLIHRKSRTGEKEEGPSK